VLGRLGRLGRCFGFLTQVRHVDEEVMGIICRRRAPNFAEDLLVRDDLSGVLHQEPEQRVFLYREVNILAFAAHGSPSWAVMNPCTIKSPSPRPPTLAVSPQENFFEKPVLHF